MSPGKIKRQVSVQILCAGSASRTVPWLVPPPPPSHHTPLARRCCWLKAAINALEMFALETIHWCALKRHVTCLECRAESALMNNPKHLSSMRQLKTSLKPDLSQHIILNAVHMDRCIHTHVPPFSKAPLHHTECTLYMCTDISTCSTQYMKDNESIHPMLLCFSFSCSKIKLLYLYLCLYLWYTEHETSCHCGKWTKHFNLFSSIGPSAASVISRILL